MESVNAVCATENGFNANLGNGANSGFVLIASRKEKRRYRMKTPYRSIGYYVWTIHKGVLTKFEQTTLDDYT